MQRAAANYRLLSSIAVLLLSSALPAQMTINVPRDQPTIQAGINAASDGDTVLIAPGKYVENINFQGKAITVTSSGGAATTILDGGATGPTVTFQNAESRSSVLSAMTVQNAGGYGPDSTALGYAGVVVFNSSPTILNNIITQNQCWDIEDLYGAPLIQGNTISSTQSPTGGCGPGSGAGVYIEGNLDGDTKTDDGNSAVIQGNTIENITVPAPVESTPAFSNADSENGGAGIAVLDGSPLIENNIIRNNSAPGGNGGGINIAGGSGSTIAQNLIYGNSAGCGGGAISFIDVSLLVVNNTIVNNTGGGANSYSSCGNVSQLYNVNSGLSSPYVVFVNNIVSGNSAAPAVGCFTLPNTPSESEQSIFDHNLFYNAGGSFFGPTCIDVSAKYGNLVAAPQFANAALDDFHLLTGSAGIDSGNSSALQDLSDLSGTALTTDFDGNARVEDATGLGYPIIDMGAYELNGAAEGGPTTIVLTSTLYAGTPGTPLTLVALAKSPLGVPIGSMTFSLDGQLLGTETITSQGYASLDSVIPSAGAHSLDVVYAGAGDFPPARSVIIIITGDGSPLTKTYTTSLDIDANFLIQTAGTDETLILTGASDDPNPAFSPTPITLTLNSGDVIGTVPTLNKAGMATFSTTTLPIGEDFITASYAGDATHDASAATVEVLIEGIPTQTLLYCSPLTITIGQTSLLSSFVTSNSGTPTGSVIFTDDEAILGQVPLVNGSATWTYVGRTVGYHNMEAIHPADGTFGYSSTIVPMEPSGCQAPKSAFPGVIVLGLNSTSVLTVTPTIGPFQTPTTMTAAVSPASPPGYGTPTGIVEFLYGTTLLGTANLVAGVATFHTIALPVGTDPVTCAYQGDSIYAPSNCNTVSVTRTTAQPVLTITPSANDVPALTPVTFEVALSASGELTPYRLPVVLSGGGNTYPLTLDPTGTAGVVLSDLLPGNNVITATFAGSANLLSASASIVETVLASSSATALSVAPSPGYVGQPVTLTAMVTVADTLVPIGASVTFYDGSTVLGTGTLDQSRTATFTTSTLAIGTHTLTATYPGTTIFSASTSPPVSETILTPSGMTISTIALSVAPSPGYVAQPVTLTAMVTAMNNTVPTGATVTFYDGTAVFGTGTLGQSGTATFTTNMLALGTHTLTASYPGTSVFAGSTSPPVSETILAAGAASFTISLSPTTVTISADQSATVAIQLASLGGFAGPLTLSYGTLPVNATAGIAPQVVTLTAGGSGSSTLTLNTAAPPPVVASRSRGLARWPAALAATLILLIPRRRRLPARNFIGGARLLLFLALAAALLQTVTACGNKFYILSGVAPGTYTIPVTATDANQNKQTAMLTLVVPPQ